MHNATLPACEVVMTNDACTAALLSRDGSHESPDDGDPIALQLDFAESSMFEELHQRRSIEYSSMSRIDPFQPQIAQLAAEKIIAPIRDDDPSTAFQATVNLRETRLRLRPVVK
jgi:hypothetical protein